MTVTSVSIYLGSKCNANCQYCHREATLDESFNYTKLFEKIDQISSKIRIHFFGGEPLLYMDSIRAIVEHYPGATYRITTNGVLLPKYQEYLSTHNFEIVISYDAAPKGNDLRHVQIPLMDLSSCHNVGISSTLYHGNTDLSQMERQLRKLGKRLNHPLTLYPHIMHTTSEANDSFSLTKEDYDSIIQQWTSRVKRTINLYEQYSVLQLQNSGYLYFFMCRENLSFGETHCVSSTRRKFDMVGNEWDCLYIRDTKIEDSVSALRALSSTCQDCDVYKQCGGACVKSKRHDLECYYYKRMFSWWSTFYAEHKDTIDNLGGPLFGEAYLSLPNQ